MISIFDLSLDELFTLISSLWGREYIFIYITKVCEINFAEAGLFYRSVSFLEETKINPMRIRAVI